MRECEEIAELLYELLSKLDREVIIVVEGRTDKDVLSKIPPSYLQVITLREVDTIDLSNKKILILTDFDKEGEHLAKRIETYLTSKYSDIILLKHYRNRMKKLIGKWGEIYSGVKYLLRRGCLEKYIRYHEIDWEY